MGTDSAASTSGDNRRRTAFGSSQPEKRLLWGLLRIRIIRCTKLRNLDAHRFTAMLRKQDVSDPYVTAFVNNNRLMRTRHVDDDLNPVFDEEFICPVAHITSGVTFRVMDKDTFTKVSLEHSSRRSSIVSPTSSSHVHKGRPDREVHPVSRRANNGSGDDGRDGGREGREWDFRRWERAACVAPG